MPHRASELGPMKTTLKRVGAGVCQHFPIRVTEWAMVPPSIAIGAVLLYQPHLFEISPSFSALARWAEQGVWGCVVLICAMMRLASLIINGTFQSFRLSPVFRLVASLFGALFWMFYHVGVTVAALFYGGAWTASAIVLLPVIIELVNVTRSAHDATRR